MGPRTNRSPLYVAGATAVLAAALAGCASASSGTGAAGSTSASAASSTGAAANPTNAVKLAAKTTGGANSFTGTMTVRATANAGTSSSGNLAMAASMAEQLHPSLLAEIKISSLSSGGTTLPGGMTELITPSTLYMNWSVLTQELHTGKPWLAIPLSTLGKSTGIDLTQLLNQATSESPLNQSDMLAGATGVREVGKSTIGGVPVTEYQGTLSIDKGLQQLPAADRAAVEKQVSAAGFTTGTFTVWIDGSNTMRKVVMSEQGTALTEVVSMTITSLNQPVNITVPAASQTTALPSADLSGLGS
jgi:hypothetical protein